MSSTAVILDNGSSAIKAGFANVEINTIPSTIIPCTIGRTVSPVFNGQSTPFQQAFELQNKQIFYGYETSVGSLHITRPMKGGIVTNWDDMQQLWNYMFEHKLHIESDEHSLLCTENIESDRCNREKMTEIMFEIFDVPNFYVAIPAVLSLYASGRSTGLVLDSGFSQTSICVIYEGYVLPHASKAIPVNGQLITNYLHSIMLQKGYLYTRERRGIDAKHITDCIKEKLCDVAEDCDLYNYNEMAIKAQKYMLPDGEIIDVGIERLYAPEILFDPQIVDCEESGIHKQICEAIMKCDDEIRDEMFDNIVLCGGNTMYHGIEQRLKKEITQISDKQMIVNGFIRRYFEDNIYSDILGVIYNNLNASSCPKIKIIAPPKRNYSSWIGGSILTQLDTFSDLWISNDEYHEYGAAIVHRKCT